jgi:hypothetical protein
MVPRAREISGTCRFQEAAHTMCLTRRGFLKEEVA